MINTLVSKIRNRLKLYKKKFDKKRFDNHTFPNSFSKDLIVIQETKKFLTYQYTNNNKFNRYDIIIRYLAIEYILGLNNYGKDLYNKMQKQRRGTELTIDDWNSFEKLIKSIYKNGFDFNKPIYVGRDQSLKDGSHRLSVALYFDIKYIPLLVSKKSFFVDYAIDWFKNNSFNKDEVNLIENKLSNILLEKEIYFCIFLWPPVESLFEVITQDISLKYKILETVDFELVSDIENFVYDIYSTDDVEKDKIDYKINHIKYKNNKIRMIKVNIGNPKFRKKEKTNTDISVKIENLKEHIRSTYKEKIDNYVYDNIIHISDNFHQTSEINRLIKRYESSKVNV